MAWLGKIIGGSLGWALGGPLGAVAGAVLGHALDSAGEAEHPRRLAGGQPLDELERSKYVFFVTTFSLLAKMAKADGVVTREEVDTVDAFIKRNLGADRRARDLAIGVFHEAKSSPHPFESFATQFRDAFRHQPTMYLEMFNLLYAVAMADRVMHPNEQSLLDSAQRIFGIPDAHAQRIRSQYIADDDRHYAILGCSRDDSMNVIKSRYRKLTHEYHPDKIIAQGLPDEFVAVANEKLQTLNEAYEAIQKARRAN